MASIVQQGSSRGSYPTFPSDKPTIIRLSGHLIKQLFKPFFILRDFDSHNTLWIDKK